MVRRRKRKRWKVWLLWSGGLAVLISLSLLGDYNLLNLWQLKKKQDRLVKRISESDSLKKVLIEEIEQLESSDEHIERIAREKYKMAKPDETVYIFEDKEEK